MKASYLPEPSLEFGYAGRHQEQRAGLMLHGPADIEFASRPSKMRIGLIGRAKELDELQAWLEACAQGVAARQDTTLETLFPPSPALRATRPLGANSCSIQTVAVSSAAVSSEPWRRSRATSQR